MPSPHPCPTRSLRPSIRSAAVIFAATLALGGPCTAATAHSRATSHASFGRAHASAQAHEVANWIVSSHDNHGANFIIVDKVLARAYVFRPDGTLRASSPVLLGLAKGDDSEPGIGDKKLSQMRDDERTTPAGRFVAEPGINAHGADVVWVDYDAAISMHRVLTNNPPERRPQRLASATPRDNRISYGCINMPPRFFDKVVHPTVVKGRTIIYILPETRPAAVQFGYGTHAPHIRLDRLAGA